MTAAAPIRRASRRPSFHPLTVAAVDRLCADAVSVTFDVPRALAGTFSFRAGQYLTLRREFAGREERRSYSICSPEGSAPRIGVRRVDGGLFSCWLADQLRPGDVVEVLPPLGDFTPDVDVPAHHGFVAAGSGITPVLSIVTSVLAACADTTVTLLYGNRRSDTVMFAEELADVKDRYPARLQLVHVLSREPRDVELFSGRMDPDRLRRLFALVVPGDVDEWWLCGPYGLMLAAESVLAERGFPQRRVHRELFYVDEPPAEPVRTAVKAGADVGSAGGEAGEVGELVVRLDGRQTALALDPSVPVLESARRVRADLPFACRGGVCGTCRAKLLDGEVRMRRNYALEQHELDAGFVLTCQAVPTTRRVVIDYDEV